MVSSQAPNRKSTVGSTTPLHLEDIAQEAWQTGKTPDWCRHW